MVWTDPPVGGDRLLRNALTFSRTLRCAGLAADLAAVLDFARALSLVDIGERDSNFHRGSIALPSDGHPPALGLHDKVIARARAVRTKAGDRAPDESGFAVEHLVSVQSESGERAAEEILQNHVGFGDEALDQAPIFFNG